jgi:hypothetical protein
MRMFYFFPSGISLKLFKQRALFRKFKKCVTVKIILNTLCEKVASNLKRIYQNLFFFSDLVHCTNEPNVSIPHLANLLVERSQNANWVVVYKALITTHHLLAYGNEVSLGMGDIYSIFDIIHKHI